MPPSSWVLRRAFLEDLGGWRLARECYINPSQDLLRRGRAAGKDMRMVPRLTAIMIPSGIRPRTYAERHHEEHDYFHGRLLQGDAFRQEQLVRIAMRHARSGISGGVALHLSRVFHTLTRGALRRLGIDSWELFLRLKYRKTGGLVDEMRRIRGLPPLER